MMTDIPDYRYRQLAEALKAYGFILDNNHYSLKEFVSVTPDKFFYFFTTKSDTKRVLVLLVEDYISDLDYVKACFSKELDARSATLHKVVVSNKSLEFAERSPVKAASVYKPPSDWDALSRYAVDFPPYYFGFLASVIPKNPMVFWDELHTRLERI